METIEHEIKINSNLDTVYNAIATVNGLQSWYTAETNGNPAIGGVLTMGAENKPMFRWQVVESKPESRIKWECSQGPGDSVGTTVTFDLVKTDDNKTIVECAHHGWPGRHGNFRKCNTYWGILMLHLKNYIESGKQQPAF